MADSPRYDDYLRRLLLARTRTGSLLAGAIISSSAAVDYWAAPALTREFAWLRALFSVGCLGVYALAGRNYANTGVYAAAASNFNDVTSGSNGTCGTSMCTSRTGWDGPTGLGTPNGVGGF